MGAETNGVSKLAETKAEKFERLRDARLPKILHAIGLLENLATPAYESTKEQRADVVIELCDKINTLAVTFAVNITINTPDSIDDLVDTLPEPTAYEQVPTITTDRTPPLPPTAWQGRVEIEGIEHPEYVHLIKVGPYIGAAIEAIDDGEYKKAQELLLTVMIS